MIGNSVDDEQNGIYFSLFRISLSILHFSNSYYPNEKDITSAAACVFYL